MGLGAFAGKDSKKIRRLSAACKFEPGWSALDAGVACLSHSSLHRQILPASARFGRRVYISASGPGFPGGTLTGKSTCLALPMIFSRDHSKSLLLLNQWTQTNFTEKELLVK
jgi:hypothetical protein